MNKKPSIPQGTRDFSADVVRKRNFIFSIIRNVFERYGFEPLETPAMENLDTLMGKYGDEGDKLIYRILNSGNTFDDHFTSILYQGIKTSHLAGPNTSLLTEPNTSSLLLDTFQRYQNRLKNEVTGKALKYDLTIPFARYVAMNHTKITFPLRRYQIQPVWRADRPQKGRYREFTQCDADVVGSLSLINEVELANIYHEVFIQLGIKDYELRINSRKVLMALAELCGGTDRMIDISIAIDKLDKVGLEKVKEELLERGIKNKQVEIIENYLLISGTNEQKLAQVRSQIGNIESGKQGITELEFLSQQTKNCNLVIDFTLARGLNYYTGIIFEAKAPEKVKMGSIGGGGRYDDLTGLFGVPGIPGVGISFGVDRIYDVMEEMKLFPENLQVSTKALFFNMGEEESLFAFEVMQKLRSSGVACEMYHEAVKISKQFSYATKKNIPFAIIIGSKEIEQKYCLVKDLSTGLQEVVPLEKLNAYMQKL